MNQEKIEEAHQIHKQWRFRRLCNGTIAALKLLIVACQKVGEWILKIFAWSLLVGLLIRDDGEAVEFTSPATIAFFALLIYFWGSIFRVIFELSEHVNRWTSHEIRNYTIERPPSRKPRSWTERGILATTWLVALLVAVSVSYFLWQPAHEIIRWFWSDVIWEMILKNAAQASVNFSGIG